MRRITPESDGAETHAAWLALNAKVVRNLAPHRDHPVVAWVIGEGPRPAHVPDPHARPERGGAESEAAA